jgi:predicted Zn finger-like uncharacterized protein
VIVECPRCSARYRVEEEVLQDDPTFKCSRCSHIFPYEAEDRDREPELPDGSSLAQAPSEPASHGSAEVRSARPSESLSFSFTTSGDATSMGSSPTRAVGSHLGRGHALDIDRVGGTQDFGFGEEEFEEIADAAEDDVDAPAEPRFVRGEDELRIEEVETHRPERPYLVFLLLVILLYGNLALYLRNHPAEAESLLTQVPLVGGALTEDRLLQTRIYLQDVEGVYQQIKDDRSVFIVSGRAVNTSDQALRGIQIESAIYDGNGKPLESKSIYCGNAMSLKIVKDLSSKEISLLQRLEPPQRFEIRPGEAAGFTVVFMNPPTGLKEFSTRVVAALRAV